MRNTFKWLGIIALVALIGVSFTACPEEFDRDGVAKTITVTNIPATYINNYGYIGLGTQSGDDVPTVSYPQKITSTRSLDLPLIDAKSKKEFDGKGTFIVIFTITETIETKPELWSGFISSKSISNAKTEINFDSFTSFAD
jgi:hypothetical protein